MSDTTPRSPSEPTIAVRRSRLRWDQFIILGAAIVLFGVFSVTAKNFFTLRSVLSLALQTSTTTIIGIGVTFTIITAGIDLSIGSVVALTGTVAVMVADAGVPIWLSMIAGLLTGVTCGAVNGLLITRLKLPPFIATLGMMDVARGVALTITNANAKPAPDAFAALGNNALFRVGPRFPGISYPLIIMIGVALVCHFILKKLRIGRYTYAVGSNEEAARLSGVKVARVKMVAYIVSGLLAALAGIILASRMVTSQPNSAVGYETQRNRLRDHRRHELRRRCRHHFGDCHRLFHHRHTHRGPHDAGSQLLHAADRDRSRPHPRGVFRPDQKEMTRNGSPVGGPLRLANAVRMGREFW